MILQSRRNARRWLAGTLSLAVVLGMGLASAPAAAAAGGDLVTPLGGPQPDYLSLSATKAAGVVKAGPNGTAWLRDLSDFGTAKVVSRHAQESLVSVGRTAVNGTSGLVLTDHGVQTAKFKKWYYADELSGAYLIGKTTKKAAKETVLANGKAIAFPKLDYPLAIFGSLVAVVNDYNWAVSVYDVASGKPVRVGSEIQLDWDYAYAYVYLWGDRIAVAGVFDDNTTTEVVVTDYLTTAERYRETFTNNLGGIYGFSDGVLLLWGGSPDYWQLVNTATGTRYPSLLEDATYHVAPALDDAGRILYATGTDLVVHKIDFAGGSAPRALWSSAASSFNAWSGETKPWKVSVDATKPLAGGSLVVTPPVGLGASVSVPVAASADGSLRISWNGRLGNGTWALPGDYTWHLEGFNGLVSVRGTTAVGGHLTVTNAPAAFPQVAPLIDHTKPVTDMVLTADPRTPPSGATVGYQWYRGTKAIPGATTASYTAAAADVGKTLKVKVSYSSSVHYLPSAAYSKATAKVGKATLVKGTVTLSDPAPQVDTPLNATLAGWGPAPVTAKYQWYRVNAKNRALAIPKATKAAYTPTAADKGNTVKVTVTGTKPGYASASVTSAVSPAVLAGAYSVVPKPTVSGTAKVGQVLTAVPGPYVNADGQTVVPTFTYQWVRVAADTTETPIAKATKATYKATIADQGSTLKVIVVAKRATYPTQTGTSAATGTVAA